MKNKNAIIANISLVIFELVSMILSLCLYHKYDLIYYTQDSNLLSLMASFIYLIYLYKGEVPKWVSIFKYISVLGLTVTFLVALFILTPMYNFNLALLFFEPSMFFNHLFCPILAFYSFVFVESHVINGWRDNIRACYFTIFYGVLTIILNILNVIEGPYPFLYVYKNPVYVSVLYFLLIVGGSFGISSLIGRIKNERQKRIIKNN